MWAHRVRALDTDEEGAVLDSVMTSGRRNASYWSTEQMKMKKKKGRGLSGLGKEVRGLVPGCVVPRGVVPGGVEEGRRLGGEFRGEDAEMEELDDLEEMEEADEMDELYELEEIETDDEDDEVDMEEIEEIEEIEGVEIGEGSEGNGEKKDGKTEAWWKFGM